MTHLFSDGPEGRADPHPVCDEARPSGPSLNGPLSYAPTPPLLHRRSFRVWVAVALLLGVASASRQWFPPLWRRAELLYWQHRCMSATPAGDRTVAADFDAPHAVSGYAGSAAFQRFYALLSPPGDRGTPAVFVHERRTPDGLARLVVVQAYTFDFDSDVGMDFGDAKSTLTISFQARVFRPGGPGRSPAEVLNRGSGSVLISLARPGRVFAGQPDPADPSHFWFTGVMHDEPFTVDGWLQPDETVTMQLRPAPRVTPAPRPGTPRRTVAP